MSPQKLTKRHLHVFLIDEAKNTLQLDCTKRKFNAAEYDGIQNFRSSLQLMRDRKSTANLGDGLNDLRLLVPYAITVIPAHKLLAGIPGLVML